MRPWVVVAGDFVRTGGMDAANHALARYLARSGRPAHLVAHRVDDALAALPGVRVHPVARPLGSHLLGFPLLARAGARVGRQQRAQGGVLLANGGNCPSPQATWLHYVHAAFAPRIAGRPLRRGVEWLARRRALAGERAAVAAARWVICNSRLTAGHAVRLLGADPARVRVVHYGAEPRFRPPSPEARRQARAALGVGEGPLLAFVGALGDRRKGFDTLFAAWRELSAAPGWQARLLVVGAGGELEAWKRRAAQAGLAGSIHFAGFHPRVEELLAACDALVAPTRYEAYGLALQEAACMGLAPVLSADAGFAERLPPAFAPLLIQRPDDAAELAARLGAWQRDAAEYRRHALSLSAELLRWSWDDMAARIVDIVEGAA